jgi:hypothetical protein
VSGCEQIVCGAGTANWQSQWVTAGKRFLNDGKAKGFEQKAMQFVNVVALAQRDKFARSIEKELVRGRVHSIVCSLIHSG